MTKKQLVTIAILLSVLCFFMAAFAVLPGVLREVLAGKPAGPGSYAAFCAQARARTDLQWDTDFAGLRGSRVTWSGQVTEVWESGGDYFAWINAGNALSGKDVQLMRLSPEVAAGLDRGQQVRFSGALDSFSREFCLAGLVDVVVE